MCILACLPVHIPKFLHFLAAGAAMDETSEGKAQDKTRTPSTTFYPLVLLQLE
jgi:hypothetical protein